MKEMKILAILIVVVGVLYWGVEPLAHSVFHPEVAPADFAFRDLDNIDVSKGNAERGKELIRDACAGCHRINTLELAEGQEAVESVGYYRNKDATIYTPELSTAGAIYDGKFLANLILNPMNTLHIAHKFPDEDFPMTPFYGIEGDAREEAADIVAYLLSVGKVELQKQVIQSEEFIAQKESIDKSNLSATQKQESIADLEEKLTNKAIFVNACSRCHSMKYDKVTSKISSEDVSTYLGAKAPDLSMMIRSKGKHYLEYFINDPQKVPYKTINEAIIKKTGQLPTNQSKNEWQSAKDYSNIARELGVMPNGLSMPRVGLSEDSQKRVIAYLESIGDAKKAQREQLGIYIMIFFAVMSVLAYLWKQHIWSELH